MTGRAIATSETSPLRVDFLDGPAPPGRIGMTFAPGKRDSGWERDLEVDLARLALHYRTSLLVSLVEGHELDLLGIPELVARALTRGIEVERFPIPDGAVPASMPALAALVERMLAAHGAGRTVVVHCRGGLGRTGLVAACSLVALGATTADEAVRAVRRARPGTIETRDQEEWVRRFAREG
jgi:protein-tyrosine phosphatase